MALGALVLSIAGIHGAMSDLVARRRPELALRVALGARPVRLVAEVVRAGLRLALAGAGAGLGIGILATPVLAYVLGRADLPSLTVLLVALAAVATLVAASSALPAWRAISVDPREVMR
jgi:ABC-type antimicrobial peptide transport system permease subunit